MFQIPRAPPGAEELIFVPFSGWPVSNSVDPMGTFIVSPCSFPFLFLISPFRGTGSSQLGNNHNHSCYYFAPFRSRLRADSGT